MPDGPTGNDGAAAERNSGPGGAGSRDPGWRLVDPSTVPVVPSPSGLPTQHLVGAAQGATATFVGQQWLAPGQRVMSHTHPNEEVLVFLAGTGEATLGSPATTVLLAAGVCLFVAPAVPHGFRNTGGGILHVLVVFPTPAFAPTTLLEPAPPSAADHGVAGSGSAAGS